MQALKTLILGVELNKLLPKDKFVTELYVHLSMQQQDWLSLALGNDLSGRAFPVSALSLNCWKPVSQSASQPVSQSASQPVSQSQALRRAVSWKTVP